MSIVLSHDELQFVTIPASIKTMRRRGRARIYDTVVGERVRAKVVKIAKIQVLKKMREVSVQEK